MRRSALNNNNSSFRGASETSEPEFITTIGNMDCGPAPSKSAVADLANGWARPGMTASHLRRDQIFDLHAIARLDDLGDPLPMATLVIALVAENANRSGFPDQRG